MRSRAIVFSSNFVSDNVTLSALAFNFKKRGLGEHLPLGKREPHTRCYVL